MTTPATRKCKTPGLHLFCLVESPNAVGQTHVRMELTIPPGIVISKDRATAIEDAFHEAMEKHLAQYWLSDFKGASQ